MRDTHYPFVSIVTVSYKDDVYLPQLLFSIEKLEFPKSSLEVIVVSILGKKKIKSIKIPLQQIFVNRNMGYSEAINIGISKSRGPYLFLPNPDVTIEKMALNNLASYLEKHTDVGIVGGKIFSMDEPTQISTNDLPCTHFNQLNGNIERATKDAVAEITRPQDFFWVCGNAIVFRKKTWEEVKKYDETYFLYWEDADFSMKVRRLGLKSVMVPDATLFHRGSASVGNTDDQVYYVVRNGRFFMSRYSGFLGRFQIHIKNILLLVSKKLQIIFGIADSFKSQAFIDGIIDFYKGKRGMRDRV